MRLLKLIFAAIKKEYLFLIGTIIIALTWYVQTFNVSELQKALDESTLKLNKFETYLIHCKQDYAFYHHVMSTKDSVSFSDSLDAVRNWFNSVLNARIALLELPIDSVHKDFISTLNDSARFYSDLYNRTKNIKDYIALTYQLTAQLNKEMLPYQKLGINFREKVTKRYNTSSYWYLVLVIVGSLILTINKGIRYIQGLEKESKEAPVAKIKNGK